MRYPASEKLEIIRLIEESKLSVKRTLEKLGVSRSKFYWWYDLYQRFGTVGLEDRRSAPGRVWNRVPDAVRGQVIDLALERPELSPRELAVTFTDEKARFISEASVYRLLSDNGSSYVAGDLAAWLDKQNIKHVRGAPNHPMTQGKIERWHQTMKNRILLENYFLPGDLEAKIGSFVDHYNHCQYHESIGNLTPADVYTGRGQAILEKREAIKRKTIEHRCLLHRQATA